jgi:hypothetical protein
LKIADADGGVTELACDAHGRPLCFTHVTITRRRAGAIEHAVASRREQLKARSDLVSCLRVYRIDESAQCGARVRRGVRGDVALDRVSRPARLWPGPIPPAGPARSPSCPAAPLTVTAALAAETVVGNNV